MKVPALLLIIGGFLCYASSEGVSEAYSKFWNTLDADISEKMEAFNEQAFRDGVEIIKNKLVCVIELRRTKKEAEMAQEVRVKPILEVIKLPEEIGEEIAEEMADRALFYARENRKRSKMLQNIY